MEMETTTAAIGSSNREGRASLVGSLVSMNAVLWLGLLVLSFALTVPVALRYEKSSALTVLDGGLAHDFEKFVTREHPYRNPSLNGWAALELRLFGEGKPGVILGDAGWLFSLEEFPLPSTRDRLLAANLEHLRTQVETLRRKGIETLIVPIPAKAEIYGEHVPAALRGHVLPANAVTDYLSAQGIAWVSVKDAMLRNKARGRDMFFRTETHWTPEGARMAAAEIAYWLGSRGRISWKEKSFLVTALPSRSLESDLESFLPLRPGHAELLPPAESYTPYRVESLASASDASALFGDTGNPVALVGTSYSADERWNFSGWLRAMLRTDIDNISEKAKGPFLPMEKFLEKLDAGKTGARLVIWELPVRSLAMDYHPVTPYAAP